MLLSFVFPFLVIITFFLHCVGSSRERQVCGKEDLEDVVRSCCGNRRVCLKKKSLKSLKTLRDNLDRLKAEIQALGKEHHKDLKKILEALKQLEKQKEESEEETTKRPKRTTTTTTTTKAPKPKIGRNCVPSGGSSKIHGIHEIRIPSFSDKPFKVVCDGKTRGGGWLIFLRRFDGCVDFFRAWKDYKKGFGDLQGEFFLGLDKLHSITNDEPQELLVLLADFRDNVAYERYDKFGIGDEHARYKLHTLGKASGTAGDSLSYHHGMPFSTFDQVHSGHTSSHCARRLHGAYWYNCCAASNLMGKYGKREGQQGITWVKFRGSHKNLKVAIMMIRPKKSATSLGF